jgi:protoporphyrinogen/coproporphyrinogen III oxidase
MARLERVAVVGAGPAGLSAAWALSSAGVRVTLFEERSGAGGRMRSDTMDGAAVDVAVQLFSSTYTSLLRLAKETGASSHIVRAPGRDALWRKGRPNVITYGSVTSMIASGALPTTLKLRLAARYLPFLAGEARGLDANDPAGSGGAAFDRESIAEWGEKHLGEDFVELLAYPLLAAYYGGLPEQTSAAVYHALARVGMDVKVLAVRGGMSVLADALLDALRAGGVEVRTNQSVDAIVAEGGSALVRSGAEESRFDGVVVAVPPLSAGRLITGSEAVTRWLSGVRMLPSATLALRVEGRVQADYFGLSFPRVAAPGESVVALCVQSRKVPGLVPADGDALVVYAAPPVAAALADADASDVVETLLGGVEAVFPGIRRRVRHARVHRFREGYTLFRPGYLRHLLEYDADWLGGNVALAGDYLVAPTVEGAVISGRRAASHLLRASTVGSQ